MCTIGIPSWSHVVENSLNFRDELETKTRARSHLHRDIMAEERNVRDNRGLLKSYCLNKFVYVNEKERHEDAGVAATSSATYYQTEIATEQLENTVEQPVAVDLKQIAEQMTHKYLLQQTCTVSVNSSSQMITIALVALTDASQKYKDKLVKIIDLLENNEWSDSELENMLMEFRYDIADAKTFYLDSISATDSALHLGQSSVQMAFTVSANTVFNSMSERIYSAEREFQSCMEEIKQVEDKFTKVLADTLKKSKNDVDIVK